MMMLCQTVLSVLLLVALASSRCLTDAFTVAERPSPPRNGAGSLQASSSSKDTGNYFIAAGLATGWILSTQLVAAANANVIADPLQETHSTLWNAPPTTTIVLAGGAYVPESSYSSMDLSMPSYNVESKAALVGGAASSAAPAAPPATPKKTATTARKVQKNKTAADNPDKEAARLAKEEAAAAQKAAAAQAKARRDYEKALAVQAKMEAKKAERAAFQQQQQKSPAKLDT